MFKKLTACLLSACMLLGLAACGGDKAEDYIFSYDIPQRVTTLDPQFATSASARMVVLNTFEGLLSQGEEGLELGVAAGYQVSTDGLTYTFTLREGAHWSDKDKTPITAQDFVFALRRLFDPDSPSPFASELRCIRGAQSILEGSLGVGSLGVTANGPQTLVITLDYPNADLPHLLSESYAMPCNEAFFLEQKGRYGLTPKTTLFNGPFVVRTLESATVALRKNDAYHAQEQVTAAGVNLYVGREDPVSLLLKGEADAAIIPGEEVAKVEKAGGRAVGLPDTVWALLLNQADTEMSIDSIRLALMTAVDEGLVAEKLTGDALPTGDFIPPSVLVGEKGYRELVGSLPALPRQSEPLRQIFEAGLAGLDRTKLPQTNLLVLDGRMERNVAGALQQCWQRELNAYINVQPLAQQDLEAALAGGDFQMILAPFRAATGKADALLLPFSGEVERPMQGAVNPVFDGLMELAAGQREAAATAIYHRQAEEYLKTSYTLLPLYTTSTYYATGAGVEGVHFFPGQRGASFKYAKKS